jgi:hypothetical protein
MRRVPGLIMLTAVVFFQPAASALKTEKQPRFNGSYWIENVAVGRMDAKLDFTCELHNVGEAAVRIDRLWLANPANTDAPYAVFAGKTLARREKVRLSRPITVPLAEYQRWEQGRAATLFLEVRDWGGGLPRVPFRIDLERRKPPVE